MTSSDNAENQNVENCLSALPQKPARLDEFKAEHLFEEIMTNYQRHILALTYSITGDFHAAQEISQDAFVKLFKQLMTRKTDARIISWLRRVARNGALDHLRKRSRQPPTETIHDREDIPGVPPITEEQRESAAEVAAILAKLPEKKRIVFEFRAIDGLSYEKIAELCNSTPDATRMLYQRTAADVRRRLSREMRTQSGKGTGATSVEILVSESGSAG